MNIFIYYVLKGASIQQDYTSVANTLNQNQKYFINSKWTIA